MRTPPFTRLVLEVGPLPSACRDVALGLFLLTLSGCGLMAPKQEPPNLEGDHPPPQQAIDTASIGTKPVLDAARYTALKFLRSQGMVSTNDEISYGNGVERGWYEYRPSVANVLAGATAQDQTQVAYGWRIAINQDRRGGSSSLGTSWWVYFRDSQLVAVTKLDVHDYGDWSRRTTTPDRVVNLEWPPNWKPSNGAAAK